MNIGVTHAWVLWLLPLCLVPIVFSGRRSLAYSSLSMIPRDRLSDAVAFILRVAAVASIALMLLALSGVFRPAELVQRTGRGAQMVLLLDRSRSMDQPFAGQSFTNPLATQGYDSKGKVARTLLSEFVARRQNDMFGMVVFSTFPIQVLPLTDKQEVIQAAIKAGNIGRGLAETDVGAGLIRAMEFFEDQPYTGSRIIILISDGGARLGLSTRIRIENMMKRHRVTLYWIYIRSRNSPGIIDTSQTEDTPELNPFTAPARALHRFFLSMKTPYRAYDAENSEALERAIEDVGRLQNLPIRFQDVVPRRDLSQICYAAALVLLALLLAAKFLEVRAWR